MEPRIQKKNRRWVGFFLLLTFLSILAIAIMIVYNLAQQLQPSQLAEAMANWHENGPKNYDIQYLRKVYKDGSETGTRCKVRVREGLQVFVTVDDIPQKFENYKYYGVPALFQEIKGFMEVDKQPGNPWTYTRAIFDSKLGVPMWYIRRVMGERYRVEIRVEEFSVPEIAAKSP